ncbi:hypothetical protein IMG5_167290 [Ichthyophthirius multifiliis]|uniref:O-acyltransferase n=1 Tax=Ichthyophthirius multifiliis TaxID=5932 RepID=G0R0W5_ICHMU|nr:hypothetical protein IMG5_167290 [Ichthyophthirius multifiliis]EGR28876.1 hypothetical protein IMG5_167290 [Ichthyophthirius multifiliis]|eukprot:XP_004030112.1 hypothetical protein IMG5_167290 [Ichthyophthirius multifiliis]
MRLYYKQNQYDSPILILELTSYSSSIINELIELINEIKVFIKYKSPLSYNPAKAERTSLLSSESPVQNYKGFLNVAAICLLVNNIRYMIDNLRIYGLQIHNIWNHPLSYVNYKFCIQFCIQICFVFLAFFIQKLNFKGYANSKLTVIFNVINLTIQLLTPIISKIFTDITFLSNIMIITLSVIIWLKLISYAHVMRSIRSIIKRIEMYEKDEKAKKQPLSEFISETETSADNLYILHKCYENPSQLVKIYDLFYFLAAPTLCFQLIYPRTQKIRKLWLLKRISELILVIMFQTVLWIQYLDPLLTETYEIQREIQKAPLSFFFERIIKLSIPSFYFWLAGFYGVFQVWLNVTSELLKYADRQFYLDWWNCNDFESFWKLWNLPVHNWCVRHFYTPILQKGISKVIANFLVFTLSAILHEWIISGALGIIGYHAFIAVWIQAPVIIISKQLTKYLKIQNSELGNCIFWISFIFIGQPTAIFIYYEMYRNMYG